MEEAVSPHISIDRDSVTAFCRRHHIKRLALFGSVLRDDFRPDSDVDVLVEFQPGHVPGLDFVTIEREFSGLLQGRRVDMVTPKFLNPRIRDHVSDERRTAVCRRVTSSTVPSRSLVGICPIRQKSTTAALSPSSSAPP